MSDEQQGLLPDEHVEDIRVMAKRIALNPPLSGQQDALCRIVVHVDALTAKLAERKPRRVSKCCECGGEMIPCEKWATEEKLRAALRPFASAYAQIAEKGQAFGVTVDDYKNADEAMEVEDEG